MIGQIEENASFRKIWNNRMIFLKSQKEIHRPADLQVMEKLIENCYIKAKDLL